MSMTIGQRKKFKGKRNGNNNTNFKDKVLEAVSKELEIKQLVFGVAPGAAQTCQQASVAVVVYTTPAVAQGTDQGQRIGQKIMIKDIQIRGYVKAGTAAVQDARIIFVRDMQCNGAVPAASQIIAEVGATTGMNSPYNQNYDRRFHVLFDKRFSLNVDGGATDQAKQLEWIFTKNYVDGKGAIMKYTGASGAIATTQSGQIFGLFLTSVAGGASPPICFYDLAIRYTDA